MASVHLLLAILSLQIYVKAAPSDISKLEDIAEVEKSDIKIVEKPYSLEEAVKDDSKETVQGQRQKRFYDYYGYGFPPMNPVAYPNYVKRDESPYTGVYGQDDQLAQIYKRLHEIAGIVRAPAHNLPPPPPPFPQQFPIYFPVIYIPQIGCGCTPNQDIPTGQQPTNPANNGSVDFPTRFPEMDDERQNWGLVVNETVEDDGQEEDFTRPISFEPIQPNRTMSRPPPPVEHGSSQAGASAQGQFTTTTMRPASFVPIAAPSACDGAILSCCHQPQVTYDCFNDLGCPDTTAYGNPCDTQVILRVIDRYQRFYGQRSG